MNHTTTVSACCGAEVETRYSSFIDGNQYTCTKCWLINCKVIDRTKQCYCQSIYNGENNTVDNCTCGKCVDAINPPTEPRECNCIDCRAGRDLGLKPKVEPTVEKMVWDFETKFGNCFQPFGEKLDEAKDFLRHSVQEAKAEERERILEAIQPAVNDFMAGANVLVEHKMVNSAKEMRENIQYIVCAIRGTHKEYAASLKQEGDKAEECRHELPKGECFICGESI